MARNDGGLGRRVGRRSVVAGFPKNNANGSNPRLAPGVIFGFWSGRDKTVANAGTEGIDDDSKR
jgi:hypothetical protein